MKRYWSGVSGFAGLRRAARSAGNEECIQLPPGREASSSPAPAVQAARALVCRRPSQRGMASPGRASGGASAPFAPLALPPLTTSPDPALPPPSRPPPSDPRPACQVYNSPERSEWLREGLGVTAWEVRATGGAPAGPAGPPGARRGRPRPPPQARARGLTRRASAAPPLFARPSLPPFPHTLNARRPARHPASRPGARGLTRLPRLHQVCFDNYAHPKHGAGVPLARLPEAAHAMVVSARPAAGVPKCAASRCCMWRRRRWLCACHRSGDHLSAASF
jgi:hypothetical protein